MNYMFQLSVALLLMVIGANYAADITNSQVRVIFNGAHMLPNVTVN